MSDQDVAALLGLLMFLAVLSATDTAVGAVLRAFAAFLMSGR